MGRQVRKGEVRYGEASEERGGEMRGGEVCGRTANASIELGEPKTMDEVVKWVDRLVWTRRSDKEGT